MTMHDRKKPKCSKGLGLCRDPLPPSLQPYWLMWLVVVEGKEGHCPVAGLSFPICTVVTNFCLYCLLGIC